MMMPSLLIDMPEWITQTPVRDLMAIFQHTHTEPTILMVGGCVRNAVIGAGETDIDLATILTPDDVIKHLKDKGIKTIPTGIDHGTVTAVMDGFSFEITTLRHDVETDGRRAIVQFTHDWRADASRRDFTMNSLFMDANGHVFDPLGQGIQDAQARHIRFVGDPATRIMEDYLRILRYFRFHAVYGQSDFDAATLMACRAQASGLSLLSKERMTQEMMKILHTERAAPVLRVMTEHDILPAFSQGLNIIAQVIDFQIKYDLVDVCARLSVLDQSALDWLVLSNKEVKKIAFYRQYRQFFSGQAVSNTIRPRFDTEREVKKAIYYYGNDQAAQLYGLSCAIAEIPVKEAYVRLCQEWNAPVFPVTGHDLIAEGIPQGPDLRQELQRRETAWLEQQI